jgi:hypothetical protein
MLPERWKKGVDAGEENVEDWHVQVSVRQLWFKKKSVPVIFEPPCKYASLEAELLNILFPNRFHNNRNAYGVSAYETALELNWQIILNWPGDTNLGRSLWTLRK